MSGTASLKTGGSVQHLDFLTPEEKDTFKTSFEIDQRWLIELAADRTPYIDQATSLNLYIPADVEKLGPSHAPLPRMGIGREVAILSAVEVHPARRFRRRG